VLNIRTFELLKNCSLYTVVTWVDTKKAIVSQLTDIKKVTTFEFVLSSRPFLLNFYQTRSKSGFFGTNMV